MPSQSMDYVLGSDNLQAGEGYHFVAEDGQKYQDTMMSLAQKTRVLAVFTYPYVHIGLTSAPRGGRLAFIK